MYEPDPGVVLRYLPELLSGLSLTFTISVASFGIALVLGLPLALASMSRVRGLSAAGLGAMDILRGTPELVQIIWIYYALPILFGLPVGAVATGTIGLGVSLSAYLAETYRAGLSAVPRGNLEAARSLGMSRAQTLVRIQLPQAALIMIPGLMNYYVLMLKRTAYLLTIGVPELMFTSYRLGSVTYRPLEILTAAALMYLTVSFSLSYLSRRLEALLHRRLAVTIPT
jgi:His/Glu/Gln/Arg/opine family amino acid ABC transporter permease subunit